MALFAGEQTVEAKAAAVRISRAVELYIAGCEAQAAAAKKRRG